MTSLGSSAKREENLSYGSEFLNCLKLLYSESLRLELGGLADILEKSFEDCASVIGAQDASINDNHQCIIEFNFLKEFRRLDSAQQADQNAPDPH